MKVFTVTNRKGGVGKSTIAAHVAGGLALRGLRVGLIDTDSQAHAGLMLGVRDGNGLHQALVEHKPLNHVVLDVQKLPVDFSRWYVPELQQGALTLDAEWQPRAVDPDVKAADRAYNEQLLAKHRQIFERAEAGQPLADWERRIVENRRAIERAKELMRGQQ